MKNLEKVTSGKEVVEKQKNLPELSKAETIWLTCKGKGKDAFVCVLCVCMCVCVVCAFGGSGFTE